MTIKRGSGQKAREKKRRARVTKIYAGHPAGWKPPSAFSVKGRARIHAALKRRKSK